MRWMKIALLFGLVELAHFLAFSALVGRLGRWRLGDVTDSFDLIAWIWVGMTEFWAGGAGTWIAAFCVVALGMVMIGQFIRWLALKRRRNELENVLRQKEEDLRVSLHDEITRQVIVEQNARERSLDAYTERLNQELKGLRVREADAEALQNNALLWKDELQAIRDKMCKANRKRHRMKQCAEMALKALDEEPQNIPLARRHLNKLVKRKKIGTQG